MDSALKWLATVLCANALTACETFAPDAWSARVWLYPGGEGEVLGTFVKRQDCQAAVDRWLQSQVVGNPISGACEPIEGPRP